MAKGFNFGTDYRSNDGQTQSAQHLISDVDRPKFHVLTKAYQRR